MVKQFRGRKQDAGPMPAPSSKPSLKAIVGVARDDIWEPSNCHLVGEGS